jgi:predicted amidohydrolase YtcJ
MRSKAIINGKVYRGRNNFCQAVLITGDRISAAGTNEDILDAAPAGTERIDAQGCLLLPGFYDCHLHLNTIGRMARMIDAGGVRSPEELIERGRALIARLKPPVGSVIRGRGLNQELFTGEKRYPTRYDLDKISQDHGVFISRVCGHVVICNSRMLEMAGLADSAPRIDGGQVDTDESGKPTGVLRENAATLVRRIFPPLPVEEWEGILEYAMEQAMANGLTSAASFDSTGPDFSVICAAYCRVYQRRGPCLRVCLQCGILGEEQYLDEYIRRGLRSGDFLLEPYLKMGPIKLFADGSLGSHTAWLRKPYRDNPGTCGLAVAEAPVLGAQIRKAHEHRLQVAVHAIGDGGIDATISGFEGVIQGGRNELRHGIIHCQITDMSLLERMAKSGILALVQPIFLAQDQYIVESRVGPGLAAASYSWGTMERLGIRAAYGTDSPVESLNPLQCIACAVTRKDVYGDHRGEGFNPQEQVDVFTAVDNYTISSAYANFDEGRLGRIAPGYLADLVLLDRDIFTLPPEEISSAKALFTMVGGSVVYKNEE